MGNWATEIWLLIGVLFILAEFTTIPGIGLLFMGLGALTTSILMYYSSIIASYQIAAFGLISLMWFLILWKPLKNFVRESNGKNKNYFNMVGMQVKVVNKNITPSRNGQVLWSGTIMNARLEDAEDEAKIDDKLYIKNVKGNILICSHKKP